MPKRTQKIATELAARLQARREAADLNVRDLGKKAGVSHATISRIERNLGGSAGLDSVDAIARALGVRAAWLAYGDGEP